LKFLEREIVIDKEDNYGYGYTTEQVKKSFQKVLTDELIETLENEILVNEKEDRRLQYEILKREFGE
jgi:hypothetical protein